MITANDIMTCISGLAIKMISNGYKTEVSVRGSRNVLC